MKDSNSKPAQYILLFILGWTFFFNLTIKELSFIEAFFQLIDTISEDMIMGAGSGIFIGIFLMMMMIFGVFSYQILSLWDGFSRFDVVLRSAKSISELFKRSMLITDENPQEECHPSSFSGIILSLVFMYTMGLCCVFFLSQGLFFLFEHSQSKIPDIVLLSLAPLIAIRGLSMFRYPYVRSVTALLFYTMGIVLFFDVSLFWLEEDTRFLLFPTDKIAQKSYIYSGILYSFLLVLIEGLFWLIKLFSNKETDE